MRSESDHAAARAGRSEVRLSIRLAAEFGGTAALLFAIVGSNHSAERLTDDTAVRLLIAAVVTGLVLAAAIALFQSVSGSHFNPSVTIAEGFDLRLGARHVFAYLTSQLAGGLVGAGAASVVFGVGPFEVSGMGREGGGLVLGEFLVTVGLVGIIVGLVRMGRTAWVAAVIGDMSLLPTS